MNVLVICPLLLIEDFHADESFWVSEINRIYLSGNFDAILFLTDTNVINETFFSFAKIFHGHISCCKASDFDTMLEEIIHALEMFDADHHGELMLMLLCSDTNMSKSIYCRANAHDKLCFVLLDAVDARHEFERIDLFHEQLEPWDGSGSNLFMSKIQTYSAKNVDKSTILLGKIDKFNRMQIHDVRKPSRNTVLYNVGF